MCYLFYSDDRKVIRNTGSGKLLMILGVEEGDAGVYTCKANVLDEEYTDSFKLDVKGNNTF